MVQIRPAEIPARIALATGLDRPRVSLVLGVSQPQGAVGGVYIDPGGMLRESSSLSQANLRLKLHVDGAGEELPRNVAAASALRKVSLRRLEEIVADAHGAGIPLTAEIRFLAGLSAVKYVFFYPETGDVVINYNVTESDKFRFRKGVAIPSPKMP